jgi:hypothetical protein
MEWLVVLMVAVTVWIASRKVYEVRKMHDVEEDCLDRWQHVIEKCPEINPEDYRRFALMLDCAWEGSRYLGVNQASFFTSSILPTIRKGLSS